MRVNLKFQVLLLRLCTPLQVSRNTRCWICTNHRVKGEGGSKRAIHNKAMKWNPCVATSTILHLQHTLQQNVLLLNIEGTWIYLGDPMCQQPYLWSRLAIGGSHLMCSNCPWMWREAQYLECSIAWRTLHVNWYVWKVFATINRQHRHIIQTGWAFRVTRSAGGTAEGARLRVQLQRPVGPGRATPLRRCWRRFCRSAVVANCSIYRLVRDNRKLLDAASKPLKLACS